MTLFLRQAHTCCSRHFLISNLLTSHGVEGLVAGGAGAVLGPAAGAGVGEHVVVPLDPPR